MARNGRDDKFGSGMGSFRALRRLPCIYTEPWARVEACMRMEARVGPTNVHSHPELATWSVFIRLDIHTRSGGFHGQRPYHLSVSARCLESGNESGLSVRPYDTSRITDPTYVRRLTVCFSSFWIGCGGPLRSRISGFLNIQFSEDRRSGDTLM